MASVLVVLHALDGATPGRLIGAISGSWPDRGTNSAHRTPRGPPRVEPRVKPALIIAAMAVGVLVVILVISAIFNASNADQEDTARLCSTLEGEYRTEVAVATVSNLTPGEDGRAQFDRAEQLARDGCPDRLPLISLARRTVYG